MMRRVPMLVVVAALLVVGGCSEADDARGDETSRTAPTTTTSTPTTTTTTTSVATTTSSIPSATAVAVGEFFEVVYDSGAGCASTGPSEVESGTHSFLLKDPTGEIEAIYIIRLDEGRTLQDAVDHQPAPGKWYPKPDWHHYTVDSKILESDEGPVFTKKLLEPGPHLVLASLYYGIPEDERIHWYCTPSFTVVETTE